MKTLTVMTPTYNRRALLSEAYASLSAQTSGDFLWMIVDDGSTDGTEDEVARFIAEGKIEIQYIRKENGGKHTAINRALDEVKTELIALCLDSDDALIPEAVDVILGIYEKCEKRYEGYVFLRENRVSLLDPTLEVASWCDAFRDDRFLGESVIVMKSSYARKFRFPVYEGEKFCTEGLVWLQMTEPFYWHHDPICTGEYLPDGYSKNIMKIFAANPKSYMEFNRLRFSLARGFSRRFKFAAYYDGFAMASRAKKYIRRSPSKGLASLALPAGFAFYLLLKLKK